MKWKKWAAVFAAAGCLAANGPVQAYAASSTEIMEQIEAYMADLEASRQESEELESEIASRQEEVGALLSEVTALNIEREDYYQKMKLRIAYFYEESQGFSLISALFSADSFADFIDRIQFQQSLYDYDSAQLEEYETLVDEIEEKQAELDEEIDSLGDMVEEQIVMQAALDAAIAVKETEYDEAVEAEEAEAAALAAAEAAAEEAAAREAERRASEEALSYAMSYESDASAESSASETEAAPEETAPDPATEEASAAEKSSREETSEAAEETAAPEEEPAPAEPTQTEEASASASASGSYNYPTGSGILTYTGGVNYFNGHMETWYTRRQWTGDLGIPGMYIGADGIIRDGDGYICVASDDDPKGTIIETSLGTGKVYDSGPGHGIIDIYTDWPPY